MDLRLNTMILNTTINTKKLDKSSYKTMIASDITNAMGYLISFRGSKSVKLPILLFIHSTISKIIKWL